MRYMLIIKSDARAEAGVAPNAEQIAAIGKFNQALIDAKVWLGAEALSPSRAGCRVVRAATGRFDVVEGPFAPPEKLLAGYWIIRVKTKADAIAWAERAPVREGQLELRKLHETEDFPVDEAEQPGGWREKELAYRDAPPAAPEASRKLPRFALLLRSDALTESGALPSEEGLTRMGALMGDLVKSGRLAGGEGLTESTHAARVYFSGKERRVVDGPFSEAKELVAGFVIMHAENRSEAVELAKRWLEIHGSIRETAEESMIEVRGVV